MFGERSLKAAESMQNLATIMDSQGKLSDAEKLLTEALSIEEEVFNPLLLFHFFLTRVVDAVNDILGLFHASKISDTQSNQNNRIIKDTAMYCMSIGARRGQRGRVGDDEQPGCALRSPGQPAAGPAAALPRARHPQQGVREGPPPHHLRQTEPRLRVQPDQKQCGVQGEWIEKWFSCV